MEVNNNKTITAVDLPQSLNSAKRVKWVDIVEKKLLTDEADKSVVLLASMF